MAARNQGKTKTKSSSNTVDCEGGIKDNIVISRTDLADIISEQLKQKLKPLQESIDNVHTSLSHVLDEIVRINTLEDQVEELKLQAKQFDKEKEKLITENMSLKEEILKLEINARKGNVKLLGVPETKNENAEVTVVNLLESVGVTMQLSSFSSVHRIGFFKKGNVRPILIKLLHEKDKQKLLGIKQTLKDKNILIVQDYPLEIIKRRKLLLPIFFEALENYPQHRPKLLTDTIILDGKEYGIHNLDDMHIADLKPEKIYTKQKLGITAFFTRYSPLSNHFSSTFQYDGKLFCSVEQFFMYSKASFFKDDDKAKEILEESDPIKNKQQGKAIKNFDKDAWKRVREDIMFEGMFQKFSQNQELGSFLRNTGTTTICEANPTDGEWGISIPLNSKLVFDQTKWKGKNLAGQLLEKVREAI